MRHRVLPGRAPGSRSTAASARSRVAFGVLTGADLVVTEAIPVIDELRLGSLSPRTGCTEPAVTIGKRLNERIRAFVTSGLSESRDVPSNVEGKINCKVSIEGSYDNVRHLELIRRSESGALPGPRRA